MRAFLIMIVALLSIAVSAKSQAVTESDLIGKWKVTNFKVLSDGISKQEAMAAEKLKKSFLQAHFEFKGNKRFSFDFEDADMKITNAHWKYNPQTKSALIQEWKDRNADKPVLMEIFIKREGDHLAFLLAETPFILLVEKEI